MNKDDNLSALLDYIHIDSQTQPAATLIWLHGLGASGEDFVPLVPEFKKLTGLPLRFLFPQAPHRPITINNGFVMPAWYDITGFSEQGMIDFKGIETSVKQVMVLIEDQIAKGFPAEKIVLCGFSQGSVIALSTLLAWNKPLGGVIALSGYLPPAPMPASAPKTPIFFGHGLQDDVVPHKYGQLAYEMLKATYPAEWHSYEVGHSVCDQEVLDIATWTKKQFGNT
jgi:phospholipase/carboxylesterase